jgi:putative addiction module component (TIGR02574 family)
MTQPAFELLQKALTLSEKERAELAASLIDSLDTNVDAGAEGEWNREIARRIEDLDSGKARTVPWDEVQRRISNKLQNGQ